eukprot:CAMPEP_0179022256 /NCGR_PEP_ID=MMETSP0796-20121207/6312_1 /TAXON_ID=73915 /ORGANISM="Pyrodinium bahamense, Strain pbaha01" /LENGTH=185 /DNA_ID=CAMNT_0020718113 /DNA_START=105 /DNA_END=663 /DNA_ORIENTATION=+
MNEQHCDDCRWEDLSEDDAAGYLRVDLEMDYGIGYGELSALEAGSERTAHVRKAGPVNRRFTVLGDCVAFRAEHFGEGQPAAAAPDWAPAVAGGSTVLGQGERNSDNPDCALLYRFPYQRFVQPRRSRLYANLGKMRSTWPLPPDLWHRILGWVVGEPTARDGQFLQDARGSARRRHTARPERRE